MFLLPFAGCRSNRKSVKTNSTPLFVSSEQEEEYEKGSGVRVGQTAVRSTTTDDSLSLSRHSEAGNMRFFGQTWINSVADAAQTQLETGRKAEEVE